MNIENIIRAWKADEDDQDSSLVANPIGEELTDQELQQATGGFICAVTCEIDGTCANFGTVLCIVSCLITRLI